MFFISTHIYLIYFFREEGIPGIETELILYVLIIFKNIEVNVRVNISDG